MSYMDGCLGIIRKSFWVCFIGYVVYIHNELEVEKSRRRMMESELHYEQELRNRIHMEVERMGTVIADIMDSHVDKCDVSFQDEAHCQELQLSKYDCCIIKDINKVEQQMMTNRQGVAALSRKVSDIKEHLEKAVVSSRNDLKEEILEIRDQCIFSKVAFSARVASNLNNVAHMATIPFSQVVYNVGDGYDGISVFTAPVAAIYFFYVHILSKDGSRVETLLNVNGENQLWIYSGGSSFAHGSGSNVLIQHLNKGDRVKVTNSRFGNYIHGLWSTFSGHLLYPD